MFLVFRWHPGTLPPPPAAKPHPAPPGPAKPSVDAPQRTRAALAAIDALRRDGVGTLADIARKLNERRVPTLSGRGAWHGAQVARAEGKRVR